MDNYSKRQFKYRKDEIFNYGELFIESEGGVNWEKLWKGSTKSLTAPFWLSFYYNLETRKFQVLIEKLFNDNIGVYQRGKLLEETKGIIKRINEIEPIIVDTPNTRAQVSIDPEILEKNKKEIEFLFDNDIVCNYPWDPHEKNDIIQFKSAVCEQFKDLLFDGYYSIIHHYENQDQQKILELEIQLKNLQDTIQSIKEEKAQNELRYSTLKDENNEYKNDSNRLKIRSKKDKITIAELTSATEKLKHENDLVYTLEDDLSDATHNDLFALLLLNELDLLDSKVWDNAESNNDVANVLLNLLKISRKLKLSATSIVRYRGIILYPHTDYERYEGWQKTYSKRITEIMNKYLPKKEIKLIKPIKLK